jgi:hypothetical protein
VAPDALVEVQAVAARLDPNKGEVAMESAKNPKAPIDVKPAWNPLDFPAGPGGPGTVVVGPNPGGPGGIPVIPFTPPPTTPPVINPPDGTDAGFGLGSGMGDYSDYKSDFYITLQR